MKRFIAILVMLQIGFIPFCGVFAMESVQQSAQFSGCEMMEETVQTHLSQHSPQLVCCTSQATQETPVQTTVSFDSTPSAAQEHATVFQTIGNEQANASAYTRFKYPPDDFERSSQSKRE